MNIINQIALNELNLIGNKIEEIKSNLNNNQKLIITLDTETTGKYYNQFQIENTSIDIVDKIIEFGAIFSIENIDDYGFKTIIPILDEENKDLGFRIFVNPFIDNHKPFHLSVPQEAFEVHNISLEFLEGKAIMECSNEKLAKPAPSLLAKYKMNETEESSYIKLIMRVINLSNILVAHNANFDVGMINEAVNDYNKINEDKLYYCGCEILDTLHLFKDVFPKEKLIAIQKEEAPIEINHKLDYLMYLAGIEERNVHGAYWDSKLLIDSYSVLLDKYLKNDYMKIIVEKQTTYLSKLGINDIKLNIIESLNETIERMFFEKLYDNTFLDFDKIKTHLILQLGNINKQKRNIITDDQIELSIAYYKSYIENNKEIKNVSKFKEKIEKMSTKIFDKVLVEIKKSKCFEQEEINKFIELNNTNELTMSHYLSQAIFYYFENKLEEEIIMPLVNNKFDELNYLLELNKKEISVSKEQIYTYFRTDGSIPTKDNKLTTVVGSISNTKKFLKSEVERGNNKIICMDFNSIVNYIKVEKYVKAFNDESEIKVEMNYGLTTLLKINIEEIKTKLMIPTEIIDNEINFEINIIAKNNNGIREFPQILANAYSDKYLNEEAYKDPYLTLEYFTKINNNENLLVTLGTYRGLIEKIVFETKLMPFEKRLMIKEIISLIKETNNNINFEIYNSDIFLYDYKNILLNNIDGISMIYTNPNLYLKNDYDLHEVRCNKYNENIYKLNNLNIFNNFKTKDENNDLFRILDMEVCSKFPQDKVNVPGLIEDLEFIKSKRPNLYKELETMVDENGELYNLNNHEKENILKIQQRYFSLKAREFLYKRFETNNIKEKEVQEYYIKRFDFELEIINKMKFDGYTLLVDDFLRTLTTVIGGLIGPGRGCLTKEAMVYTFNNDILEVKPINEIKVGDKVISHNNEIKDVTETFVYDIEEELINIETFHSDNINPIILTKDHKIYVGNNEWKEAKDITTKDYLYLPIPKYKEIEIKEFDLLKYINNEFEYTLENDKIVYTYSQNKLNEYGIKDLSNKLNKTKATIKNFYLYVENKNNSKMKKETIKEIETFILNKFNSLNEWYEYVKNLNIKKVNRYLNNTYSFRKFLGRWIGDGCIQKDLKRQSINIVFHKDDNIGVQETIDFINENNYSYAISTKKGKSIVSIDILDKCLHSFIKNTFNNYKFESNSKYFPNFVNHLPKEEIKDIIDGYIAADGHIDKLTKRIRTTTVSKELAYGLRKLLLQVGIPSTIKVNNREYKSIKLKEGNIAYTNEFPCNKTTHSIKNINPNIYEIVNNEYIKLRVRKIVNIEKTKTKVYDFTVENDHSYTTTNFIVHNSAAGSLVSWAYGITNVDPMLEYLNQGKHLLFERYLNPDRISLPDIDMDMNGLVNKSILLNRLKTEYNNDETIDNFINIIESKYIDEELLDGKGLIEDYQISLYGKDKVAKIVTRGTYQAKSAISAICEFLGNDFAEDVGFKLKGTPYLELASRISGNAFTKPGVGFNEVFDIDSKFYNPYFVNLYNSNGKVKKIVDLAKKLEGSISNYGVHAAGVLILDPKNNYLNNGYMIVGGVHVSLLDGKFVEDYINIKFDFLGLASLEEIDKTLQFIEKTNNSELKKEVHRIINNEYVLYNDEETFKKVFDTQNTKKIFQFSSDGMQDLVKRVEPKVFEDLVAITALYRPGPMESGMVDSYVRNKKNPELIFYPFKELEIALEPTYGNIVYQEQVMKIVQVLGGFSLGGADLVRRAMGKKIKEELDRLKGQFIDGVIKTYENRYLNIDTIQQMAKINEQIIYIDENNKIHLKTIKEMNELNVFKTEFNTIDYGQVFIKDNKPLTLEETSITKFLADELFENIIKFAGYGFNKSHAYAYTNVSMQMAYLKAHYPLEFFASILVNNADDIEKLSEYIIDSKKNNIKLYGVDINKSNLTFDIIEDYIIYGLSNIKGVSNKDIKKILDDKNANGLYKSFEDFLFRFVINHKGSYKTIENLIYAGAFDTLNLDKKDFDKFLFYNNLNSISITEEKDVFEERQKIKQTYLKSLFNTKKSLFDDDELPLNDRIIDFFNISDKKHLLPLVITKLLNNKESTTLKMINSKTDNSKIKLITELENHFNLINITKEKINYDLDLSLIENKRSFLFKLIDIINEENEENINKRFIKHSSLINLSNIEFENTGSLSNFGSLLNRHYIFSEYEDVEVLNLLKDQFNENGIFRYRGIIRDIISGKNDKDEIYMSLVIIDENEIEQRFYLTQDQIFRYKNNLSNGDPIVLELEIKEQKEKFYKKLLSIDVLKENKNWESDTVFNLPLLSINDLDQELIKRKESLKVDFCTLVDIKEDWLISQNNWPGLDEGNKQVVLILLDYKQITTKENKVYQIITVTDGIGNSTIELLYSNLNLIELENNKRKPIIIELGKRSNNGYGLGAAYKSEIIYLGDKYIKKDDEDNIKSIVRKTTFNEILDGKEHINVYSKGKTLLGRQLSNLADISTKLEIDNELIDFATVEGCWYFLKIYLSTNKKDYDLTKMNGYEAKSYGMEKTKSLSPLTDDKKIFFQEKIKEVVKFKILNNENLLNDFINNELPYVHYYNYSGNIKNLPETIWLMDFLNKLKDVIK